MYKDRIEAGRLLAKKLESYSNTDAVIVAIPRGGVPLGYEISQLLQLPLEIVLSKKIGHPLHKEYAIGAVTLKSSILSDAAADISPLYIEEEIKHIRALLNRRYEDYYNHRKPLQLKGKILIVVDDGIATGSTMLSIINMLHDEKPDSIIVAIPVAPFDSIKKLKASPYVDEVICPLVPDYFRAVGQFYADFEQVDDLEVKELLNKSLNASA
ncbi:phosphoribosyltransferase [Aestuariivivens sediminicola]|uniref:phosphoribosyltransferase n=1 Tax=Aestuariivivens sediminicola TaxID=2913560 RepID=UPI001F593A8E|nr:phosphoribosyltransferase family protein [Aestuariivivens sediminicola]